MSEGTDTQIPNLSSTWRRVVSFMLQPLYSRGKKSR